MQLTIRKTWTPSNPSAAATGATVSVVRDDTGETILAATSMSLIGAGIFSYTIQNVPTGTLFTATIIITYGSGQTFTESQVISPEVTPEEMCWPHGFRRILNHLTSLLGMITLTPKPSYNVENHQVEWQAYQDSLVGQIERVTRLLVQQEPYEFVSGGQRGD